MGRLLGLAILVSFAATAHGQFGVPLPGRGGGETQPARNDDPVTVETYWSADGVTPGGQIVLAVVFDIAEPYHLQTRAPQLDWLIPTEVKVTDAPPGVISGDIQWPDAKPIEVDFGGGPQTLDFYAGRAVVFTKVTTPERLEPGEHPIEVFIRYQACDDAKCLAPVERTLELTLNVAAGDAAVTAAHEELFAGYTGVGSAEILEFAVFGYSVTIDPNLLYLLLPLAALGGFLLNFTPCVLPLIPIKIMGLRNSADNRGQAAFLGLVMALGVVAFWMAIGGAIAFIAGFDAISELFKSTTFTIGIGVIIALMGVGMFGLFNARLPQWVYRINPSQDTVHGSFGFGVMTAVLSTPCTAPFMGTAASWAATQSPTITLATFGSIGGGMALPYLVLAIFPQLVHRMPRTGPASELIKQIMGLLMLAAGAFFAGTGLTNLLSTPPDPPSSAYWWAVGFFIAAAGVWLAIRTVRITPSAGRRAIFVSIGLLLMLGGGATGYALTRDSPINWVYYTPERLEQARQSGDVIVLDFTAAWCLNCHALERGVLQRDAVVEQLNSDGVTPIKVDISKYVPAQQYLTEVGSRTIPLLIVRDGQGNEVFRSEAYNVSDVVGAIERARGGSPATASAADRP